MRMFMLCSLAATVLLALSLAQHKEKQSVVQGEVVCLSCYLSHGAKDEKHAKCAATCINKGLPMGILTADGKLFVALEDHANADAYQQLKKFAAKQAKMTGVVHARSGITGIAVQKVNSTTAKASREKAVKVQYVCPMGCIPPQDKPGNCPKCGMKLVEKK